MANRSVLARARALARNSNKGIVGDFAELVPDQYGKLIVLGHPLAITIANDS
jgi:hypothetical protein